MLFSGMKKGLKSIDFYQAVASQHSQGTVSGACISITLVIVLCVMLLLSINQFLSPITKSDLIIDQKHLNQPLRVNIDIQFPRYACSMLSLDIENVLKVHKVNIGDTVKKYELPGDILYDDINMDKASKKKKIEQDFRSGKGCRMKGYFEIDRVPGNFHFSCHGYGDIIQQFINEGTYRDAHKMIDMSHIIHHLIFGKNPEAPPGRYDYARNSLKDFHSQKQIREAYLGISYTYFLDILEQNKLRQQQATESYFYTARLNEVILASAPMVFFKYQTNPMTVIRIQQNQQYHQLFVTIVGLIGGIFTIAIIIDQFVHSSIHFLMQKHRLGKLK